MTPTLARFLAVGAALAAVHAQSSCPSVSNTGASVGEIIQVDGVDIYVATPPGNTDTSKAVLHISDIFGIPLLENRLLADSIARANYTVFLPDLFDGEPVPRGDDGQPAIDLAAWSERHPTSEVDRIINTTIQYIREERGVQRLAGAGYCFGGRHVPRWLTEDSPLDIGFIAHPSNLQPSEIEAIAGPISIAAGGLDDAFNVTARRRAEDILDRNDITYQSSFYVGAPHGFAVTTDLNDPRRRYAKEASYLQAISWFDAWL